MESLTTCKSKMKDLEPIIKYKMTEMEAKAYKIALIWQEECHKELNNENFVKLKKNSDPRKSTLFKYCYKLASELKGIIKDNEIPLYIRAQLQILKSIREGEIHALIEPHCLVGEKAWKRWKLWRHRYRKTLNAIPTSNELGISTKQSKVMTELKSTFDFMKSKECIDKKKFSENLLNIRSWIGTGEISCFYTILSPWIRASFGQPETFEFDVPYHRASITPQIEHYFREVFLHEFEDKK